MPNLSLKMLRHSLTSSMMFLENHKYPKDVSSKIEFTNLQVLQTSDISSKHGTGSCENIHRTSSAGKSIMFDLSSIPFAGNMESCSFPFSVFLLFVAPDEWSLILDLFRLLTEESTCKNVVSMKASGIVRSVYRFNTMRD